MHGNKAECKRLQGIFRAKAKHDREAYFQSLATDAEDGMQHHSLKAAYGAIQKIRGAAVLRSDGSPCPGQSETL